MSKTEERGFIMPLAMFLVFLMTVSGMSFLHLHFLERRVTRRELDNHGAFYLAHAGIDRARATFKIPPDLTWTTVLNGTYDGADADFNPDYPVDPAPVFCETCLCGNDSTRGCVIPSFGDNVSTGPPFGGTFDDGRYRVRAFNNESGTTDTDKILIYRALGEIRGEEKLIEITAKAVSGLRLITCQGDEADPCPDDVNGTPEVDPMEGREPASFPTLPFLDPPLSDPDNYYRNPGNLPGLNDCSSSLPSGNVQLTDHPNGPNDVQIQDNCYYFTNNNVKIDHVNSGRHDIFVVSLGQIEVGSSVELLLDTSLVGEDTVRLKGGVELHAPLPYAAIISSGAVQADANVVIYGAVLSTGEVNLNPVNVHGPVIGNPVEIQGGEGSLFTDDDNEAYYDLIPGVTYPPELLTNASSPNSWNEII